MSIWDVCVFLGLVYVKLSIFVILFLIVYLGAGLRSVILTSRFSFMFTTYVFDFFFCLCDCGVNIDFLFVCGVEFLWGVFICGLMFFYICKVWGDVSESLNRGDSGGTVFSMCIYGVVKLCVLYVFCILFILLLLFILLYNLLLFFFWCLRF